MTLAEALPIIRDYQDWRRDAGLYNADEPVPPKHSGEAYGEALDVLIAHGEIALEEMQKEMFP